MVAAFVSDTGSIRESVLDGEMSQGFSKDQRRVETAIFVNTKPDCGQSQTNKHTNVLEGVL